ncbi:MAG: PhnD/SsuA/transferrin family substrate-binding protein [Planctomycetota bacterium]|nr:PhnD/SsuA/transferrin family substrate-binding protein [Planctomycetota bacterium]
MTESDLQPGKELPPTPSPDTRGNGRSDALGPTGADGVPSARRHVMYLLVAAIVLLTALLALVRLAALLQPSWPQQPYAWVDLDEPSVAGAGHERDVRGTTGVPPVVPGLQAKAVFRFAVVPVISPAKSLEQYQPLVDCLASRLGRAPVLLRGRSYGEIVELLRNKSCDAALISAYALVRGEREFGLQALVVPQVKGAVTCNALFLVSSSSPAASLLQLQGKRFAAADVFSTCGWLYPTVWLKTQGADADRFFGEYLITGSHDRSLQAVATGYVDCTALNSVVYEQMTHADPNLAAAAKVILKSPPLGMPPVVVPPNMDSGLRQALLAVFLGAHEDPAGKQVLASLGVERFTVPEDSLYDDVRRAVDVWESRTKR